MAMGRCMMGRDCGCSHRLRLLTCVFGQLRLVTGDGACRYIRTASLVSAFQSAPVRTFYRQCWDELVAARNRRFARMSDHPKLILARRNSLVLCRGNAQKLSIGGVATCRGA